MVVLALIGYLPEARTGSTDAALDDSGATRSTAHPSTTTTTTREIEALDISALLDKVQPSVVAIYTGTPDGEAAVSGIVLTADGLVLTNADYVEGATSVEVHFFDGQISEALVINSAPEAGIALVQASDLEADVVPAELGSSADLLVGDHVVAIGNALKIGSEPSVTTGIVSHLGRSVHSTNGILLDRVIQTDAAINPGHPGGPLVNAEGQVIGLNTGLVTEVQSIGYALEIDSIRDIIEDFKAGRDAARERAFLGVKTRDVSAVEPEVIETFGVTAGSGAIVQEVAPGSTADAAGLQEGDVIIEADGRRISTSEDVVQIVRAYEPGDEIEIVIERVGQEMTLTGTLGSAATEGMPYG